MLARQRYQYILNLLKEEQVVSVKQLQGMFDVSSMTLWRDLKALEADGFLKRIHGGVCLNEDELINHEEVREIEVKRSIIEDDKSLGFYAATRFVRKNDIILLDGGIDAISMIPFLKDFNVTILTNSVKVISKVSQHLPESTLFSSGGMLKNDNTIFVGPEAESFFERFSCGTLFLGCDGIANGIGLTVVDPLDNEVRKAMIKNAQKVIIFADSQKIGKRSLFQFASLEQVDVLITNDMPSEEVQQWLKNANVELAIAEPVRVLEAEGHF